MPAPPGRGTDDSRTAAAARWLRVGGIWLCTARGGGLTRCPCFAGVAVTCGPGTASPQLARQLTGLRAAVPG